MEMKPLIFLLHSLFVISCITLAFANESDFDPYKILQIRKSSSTDEIRKQYKKLAREWHPDKNKDPDAGERFTQINKAYEILGDDKRKEQYDRFGKVDDNQFNSGGGHQGGQFFRTPFGDFQFSGGGFEGESDDKIISDRYLQNHILPESYLKPYFFFATTDFCFNCVRMHPIWKQFTKDLDTIDVGYGVVDVDYEMRVVKRLHIPRVPCIGAIVNGRSIIFESDQYSVKILRQFARKLLPDDLIKVIDITEVDNFLNGWTDNKVRVIFFGTHGVATMRLLIPLYQVRDRITAAFVDTSSPDSVTLLDRFDVEAHIETLLIFREDPDTPAYAESRKQFETVDVLATLKSYQYLWLPRLSSPDVFEELCPVSSNNYCVILTFDSPLIHNEEVKMFREFVTSSAKLHNVVFLYAYADVQKFLADVWTRPAGDFKIAVIERHDTYSVYISWLDWCLDRCQTSLQVVVSKLMRGSYRFADQNINRYDIRDELAAGLLSRIFKRLINWWDYFTYAYFDGDHILTIISILSTTVCVVIVTFLAKILHGNSSQTSDKTTPRPSAAKASSTGYAKDPGKFTIYDLRSHNHDKLLRDSLPGYRFILLLVDEENKQRYVRRFADLMMPFNRTPYFIFGFMYIDKYLSWYQRLLSQTVGFKTELRNISAQLCVGTVLAINGHRKYYNIYHPKTLNLSDRQTQGDAAFIGLDDSSDSDEEAANGNGHALNGNARTIDGDSLIAEGRLLDGLGNWVDRLFDGSLPKCKIQSWPVFPTDAPESDEAQHERKKDQ